MRSIPAPWQSSSFDLVDSRQQIVPLGPHGLQIAPPLLRNGVIFPGRQALRRLPPGGGQQSLPQQPPEQRIDGTLLRRQNGPLFQAADEFVAVALSPGDHQQDAELQRPPLDLWAPLVNIHDTSPPTGASYHTVHRMSTPDPLRSPILNDP